MSIQPHAVIEYDPFEGQDFIPPELRRTNPEHHVTVFNTDPALHPEKEADLFGLELLLGVLAGARPFGEQTPTRVRARKDFHELMAAGLKDVAALQHLGRLSFFDIAPDEEVGVSQTLAEKIELAEPRGSILAIVACTFAWQALTRELVERVKNPLYIATYKRRNPPTEKGMAWTITPATSHPSRHTE